LHYTHADAGYIHTHVSYILIREEAGAAGGGENGKSAMLFPGCFLWDGEATLTPGNNVQYPRQNHNPHPRSQYPRQNRRNKNWSFTIAKAQFEGAVRCRAKFFLFEKRQKRGLTAVTGIGAVPRYE
jgi:hypothetical protein